MKISLDPYMLRGLALPEMIRTQEKRHEIFARREFDVPITTFHLSDGAGNVAEMLRYAGAKPAHLHIADSFNHRASSGLRYIVNPPGSTARVHQHLDIGQGEVELAGVLRDAPRLGRPTFPTVTSRESVAVP